METVGDRIERLRVEAGLSQAKLARLANVSQQAINQTVNGRTAVPRGIERIARVLGVTTDYLLTGEGDPKGDPEAAAFVTLPRLNPNAPNESVGLWKMRRTLLDEMQLPHHGVAVYRATAQDAVSGVIGARDLVLIDRNVTNVERESVYLVELDGALRLRFCSRDYATGAVIVSALVPTQPPQTIPVPQLARLHVIGRAVYRMGELP